MHESKFEKAQRLAALRASMRMGAIHVTVGSGNPTEAQIVEEIDASLQRGAEGKWEEVKF